MSGRPPLFAAHPPLSLSAEAKVCHLLQVAKNGVSVCPKNLLTKIGFRVNKTNALICRGGKRCFRADKAVLPDWQRSVRVLWIWVLHFALCFLCLHGSCGYTFRKVFIGLENSR